MSAPKLTENEWRIINDALGWIEAAGDESEFAETCTSHEWRHFERALKKVRVALAEKDGGK